MEVLDRAILGSVIALAQTIHRPDRRAAAIALHAFRHHPFECFENQARDDMPDQIARVACCIGMRVQNRPERSFIGKGRDAAFIVGCFGIKQAFQGIDGMGITIMGAHIDAVQHLIRRAGIIDMYGFIAHNDRCLQQGKL